MLDRPLAYSVTQWGARDGLPSGTVYSIAQTPDGFLWLGTADGLVRFDGLRFLQVPLQAGGMEAFGRVRALLVSRDGLLWAGTEGGNLVRLQGGAKRLIALHSPVKALREQEAGAVDVLTASGVVRIATETGEVLSACSAAGPGGNACTAAFAQSASAATLAAAHLQATDVRVALRDSQGGLWLGSAEHGVSRVEKPGESFVQAGRSIAASSRISRAEGLSNDSVWAVFEDREANLWIGTQSGLNRVRNDNFAMLTRSSGLLSGNLSCIAAVNGEVYAGSSLGLNRIAADGAVQTILREKVLSLAATGGGAMLAATPRGIVQIQGKERSLLPLGVHAGQVSSMADLKGGSLLIFDERLGLLQWRRGQRAQRLPLPAGEADSVSTLRADGHGGAWLGFASGAPAHFDGLNFQTATAGAIPASMAHSLALDGAGGVWAGTEGGLWQLTDGQWQTWSKRNGLPGNRVLWAVPGKDGRLWLGFNIGVASVAVGELRRSLQDRAYVMQVTSYENASGLRSNPELKGNDPVAVLPDGRIWLMTVEGLATVDPAHLKRNEVPPLVQVTDVTADEHALPVHGGLTLPKLTRRLEIGYTGLSFTEPRQVTYRYRLNGFDSAWHDADGRRLATYTNLPPGQYEFQVAAANEEGVWSARPGSLAFTLPPAFYQTRWFFAVGALLLLLAVVLAARRRVFLATQRAQTLFDERLKERERVARDLHDNLLQDVLGISLQLEIADELTPAGAAEKPVLGRALGLAASALAHGRGALTTLRAAELRSGDLLESIVQVSQRFGEDRRKALHVRHAPSAIAPLQAHVAEEVAQIGREALANALRHTAGRVEVSLLQDRRALTLIVRDSGAGIAPEILRNGVTGHYGITGMRERARRIAAELTIEQRGSGTAVSLRVPGEMAYAEESSVRNPWNGLYAWLLWKHGSKRIFLKENPRR